MAYLDEVLTNAWNIGSFGYGELSYDGLSDWTIAVPELGVPGHVLSPAPANMADAKTAAITYLNNQSKHRISNWRDVGTWASNAIFVVTKD